MDKSVITPLAEYQVKTKRNYNAGYAFHSAFTSRDHVHVTIAGYILLILSTSHGLQTLTTMPCGATAGTAIAVIP